MFTDAQNRLLAGKLSDKAVKTPKHDGRTLSYLEGWHLIAEANRIFGFDGWDRETLEAECIWQDGKRIPKPAPMWRGYVSGCERGTAWSPAMAAAPGMAAGPP